MPAHMPRLLKEWQDLKLQQPPLCYIEPSNEKDLTANWRALILGPPESPYDGTAIFVDIKIPDDYPFKGPRFTVKESIYNPIINKYGAVCLEILKKKWMPAFTIAKALQMISDLLSDPHSDHVCILNPNAAKMYQQNREEYYKIVRKSCQHLFTVPEYQHLYMKFIFWHSSEIKKKKVLDTRLIDLSLPNDDLKRNIESYEKIQLTFFSTMPYKMVRRLYPMIKAAENDIEKWIELLMETGDVEYVANNIGYRLCNDVKNEYLWKMYLKFLREHGNIQMLIQMYSIFCRFFPEDTNTLEEYKKAVEESGISIVPWKNQFEYEYFDPQCFRQVKDEKQQRKPITCYFSSNNAAPQRIPFKKPLINYILQQASPELLQKLHMSCKYLFIQMPTPVCYKLEILSYCSQPRKFEESSVLIKADVPINSCVNNIYLSTILSVKTTKNPLCLSQCLFGLKKCDAKFISIWEQNLTESELKFLISSKNVVELELDNVRISSVGGNGMMLENILQLTPKIKRFNMTVVPSNPHTMQLISELLFENKIEYFRLGKFPFENLEPYAFAEFVKKNAAPKSTFQIRLSNQTPDNSVYADIVKNKITQHWPQESGRPEILIN